MAWHTAKAFAPDDAAFDVLAYLLGHLGRGRLQQVLNRNQQQVADLRVMQVSRQHGGLFRIDAIPAEAGWESD